jgi:hypothetical protein
VADFLQQPAKKCAKYPLLTACTGFSPGSHENLLVKGAGQSRERDGNIY